MMHSADSKAGDPLLSSILPEKELNNPFLRLFMFFIRILSYSFSNLKIIWISIQLIIVCNIQSSITAIGVNDQICHWYWGIYDVYADDDHYVTDLTVTSMQPTGENFQMVCNNQNCTTVCPGDCKTHYYSGATQIEENMYGVLTEPTCQIQFYYLKVIFGLVVLALSADAVLQLYIGVHMLYNWRYPDRHWGFTTNLHIRSVFITFVFLLQPISILQFLFSKQRTLYPLKVDVEPTPYWYTLMFNAFVDIPYAISSIFWALFSANSLDIFLAVASIANVTLNFVWLYYLQFIEDIQILWVEVGEEDEKIEIDLSEQILPIR